MNKLGNFAAQHHELLASLAASLTTPAPAEAVAGVPSESKSVSMRQIVYAFFALPMTRQMRIAIELDLLTDESLGLSSPELIHAILKEAKRQGRLAALHAATLALTSEVKS